MVRFRCGNHKLSRILYCFVDCDSVFKEQSRIDKIGFVSQELWTRFVTLWETLPSEFIKLFCFFRRNTIPASILNFWLLWFTKVKVIDGVEVKILFMPCKKCFPGSNVKIRSSYSLNIHF
jgi:hypothetical protein